MKIFWEVWIASFLVLCTAAYVWEHTKQEPKPAPYSTVLSSDDNSQFSIDSFLFGIPTGPDHKVQGIQCLNVGGEAFHVLEINRENWTITIGIDDHCKMGKAIQ